ncbi:iron-sulfur cluster assembly accessory protein [Candidatus Marinimicrobia bacterium]|nr:iron-sulfur cluster assembly accessory protein [Candidatus Neomarinimicrobiota bacterium]
MIKSEKSIETQQNEFKDASITVTKNAVNQLKTVMKADSKEDYLLRMSVEGGGCSGMTYKMDFEKEKLEFDKVFKSNGLTVICELKSWLYLQNVEIDYSNDLLNGGFKIKNPNAERTCGCGTSFSA